MQYERGITMLIETMPEVLMWSDKGDILEQIYGSYIELLSDSLGEVLHSIVQQDQVLGDHLIAGMRGASSSAFLRVLTAPETSYHLLFRNHHHLSTTGKFLAQSFRAETLREGMPIVLKEETWTALGDMGFFPDGTICHYPQIDGLMPLDFGSPHATKLNLEGFEEDISEPLSVFERGEIDLVLDRLKQAQQGIAYTSLEVLNFVVQFTKVLILKKDPATPEVFSSGSNSHCVGRSLIVNPQAITRDEVDLAESIVHEAIHALLYMQERKESWVQDPMLYDSSLWVISPWTGNNLALWSFLQACFVWYGLLHFWHLALSKGKFNHTRICMRMDAAAKGFLDKSLLDHVAMYRTKISPDLLRAIEGMQDIVREVIHHSI